MPADKSFQLLICLLRLAVTKVEVSFLTPSLLVEDNWGGAYRYATKHAVIALAWDGVERLQAEAPDMLSNLPSNLMGKWFADVQLIEAANVRMAQQAARVQEFLKIGGFGACILKGSSSAMYYPKSAHRQSADIDLWVHHKPDVPMAVLRSSLLAYLRKSQVTIGEVVYHHIATMMDGTEVELHVTPTWLYNPWHNRHLQQIFTKTDKLTPEQQELYSLLHAFRHIYHDGLSLHHILDYCLISQTNRASGVSAPVVYSQLGLSAFAKAMDELVKFLFQDIVQSGALSCRANHLLTALPARQVSVAVKADYLSETFFALPWRTIHFLWRRRLTKE